MNKFSFLHGGMEVKHIDIVKNRTEQLNASFKAIAEARTILSRLEAMTGEIAEGKGADISAIAASTSSLRNCTDRILAGMVEAQTIPGVYLVPASEG